MTEQELREQIAEFLIKRDGWTWAEWELSPYYFKNNDRMSPDTYGFYRRETDQILNLIKEAGWVELDEDQSLPDVIHNQYLGDLIVMSIKEMAGFRKVKPGSLR
jgi:hypothetical protein